MEVGTKHVMLNHIARCTFMNVIECPDWTCKTTMTLEFIVAHLKKVHKSPVYHRESTGEIKVKALLNDERKTANYTPIIASIDGETFLINRIKRNFTMIFWVTIVGFEKDAQKFEAKVIASSDDDAPLSIRTKGKVYSLEMKKEDLMKDKSGALEINKDMANKMGKCTEIDYHIVSK